MMELIRNKLKWKNIASATLEKHWELRYKDLESQYEALKDEKSARHEEKNIQKGEYESLISELQDLRSSLDEKTEENISLRDDLVKLNSLIATKEAEKGIISAQLREVESLREAHEALSEAMLEEALLREEAITAEFENALRLKSVSIATLKERHASETQRLTTVRDKIASDLAEALREAGRMKSEVSQGKRKIIELESLFINW